MIMLGAIDMLMVAVIIVFYMLSVHNQEKAENTLVATEKFISGLSVDLKTPVNNIINISDKALREDSYPDDDVLRDIREDGKRLKEKMDNLFSYSNILRGGANYENASDKSKENRKMSVSSRYIRNGIIGILVIASLIGLFL